MDYPLLSFRLPRDWHIDYRTIVREAGRTHLVCHRISSWGHLKPAGNYGISVRRFLENHRMDMPRAG
jgi:hypothetical protein